MAKQTALAAEWDIHSHSVRIRRAEKRTPPLLPRIKQPSYSDLGICSYPASPFQLVHEKFVREVLQQNSSVVAVLAD